MKLAGALLLCLGSFGGGWVAARRLKQRVQNLQELAFALGLLGFELESFCRPLPEICARLAATEGAGGALFARLCHAIRRRPEESFAALWGEALAPLAAAERRLLEPLGEVLGRYGAPEQRRALALCQKRMETLADEAREQYRRSARLYIGLGASLGAGISLLLL